MRDPSAGPARPRRGPVARRWRAPSAALAVLLAACWYPKERGQELEGRVDRVERAQAEVRPGPPREERVAAAEDAGRLEASIAEVRRKLDELRAALDAHARRLDAVERSTAQLRASAPRAQAARKVPGAAPPPGTTPGVPGTPGAAKTPSKADFLALAREQEAKGQKAVARDMYQEYVERFPGAPDAAEARFRLGELAFAERRYRDAIVEYGRVAKDFPRSREAPDALLRTAESMAALDLRDDAATVLSEVPKRYPGSQAAARAKERLAELSGAGQPGKKPARP